MFYGSQTGTAEEFAIRLSKDARRHGMPAMAFDPEECTDWVCMVDGTNWICVVKYYELGMYGGWHKLLYMCGRNGMNWVCMVDGTNWVCVVKYYE